MGLSALSSQSTALITRQAAAGEGSASELIVNRRTVLSEDIMRLGIMQV